MISIEEAQKLFHENGKGTIQQAKDFLADHDIHQLRKGETMRDAMDSVLNSTSRKGYEYKRANGTLMTENQIIQASNKEAFMKFTPAEYTEDEVEDIDDICASEDYREDDTLRGIIINCFYCGTCLRVDGDVDETGDYPEPQDTVHCEDCMRDAIARLAM
jgi:hypothetical protein